MTGEANLEHGGPLSHKVNAAQRSLVLVGLMGVGKSTVGRRLASRMRLPFVDADDEIEAAAGRSVADIFNDYGEAEFREGERRVIRRLLEGPRKVIASGGGAFAHTETRQLILNKALAIWLDADVDVLVERTSRRETRPLLQKGDPRTILTELARKRSAYYALAPIHVRSVEGPHDAVVEAILGALAQASAHA